MSNTITQGIDTLTTQAQQPYTATASVKDGAIDAANSTVTGDRSHGLFTTKTPGRLGTNDFLTLLLTQLRQQDPLTPMDNAQMMNQLSQLSALESNNNMQLTLAGLKDSFQGTVDAQKASAASITNAAAVSLMGKEVRLKQTTVTWGGTAGESAAIRVHVGSRNSAEVKLLDGDGKVVKTLSAGGKDGENSVTIDWDGSTDEGKQAKPGTYAIAVTGEETNADLYAFVQNTVDGVRFASDGALLKVDGKEITVANVMDVSPGEGAAGADAMPMSSAVALLGKSVRLREDTVNYHGVLNENVTFGVNLGSLSHATVRILDAKGATVAVLPAVDDGSALAGADRCATVSWDGTVLNGQDKAARGVYTVVVDQGAINPSVYAYVDGVVDGISNADGATKLRVNGQLIPVSRIIDIASVQQGSAT